jgi:peptidoglycan/LPS O-acetylase OafA/YrhL
VSANNTRSMTSQVHSWTLPLKVFFLLTLLVISILLALRRQRLEDHYAGHMGEIEKGVLIGAAAMLFFPVMNHAFLQSAAMLDVAGASNSYRGPAPFFSFIFGAWALVLVFFFYRRRDKEVEFLGRIGGVIASAVAILKYDIIISYFVRYAGSGASPRDIGILVGIGLLMLAALRIKTPSDQFTGARVFGAIAAAKVAGDALSSVAGGTSDGQGPDTSPLPDFGRDRQS